MTGAAALTRDLMAQYPFLQRDWAHRLITSYGTLARQILGSAQSLADCGAHFGHGLTACEVDYLIDREWARETDDILWRRSKLGLRLSPDEVAALDGYLRTRTGGAR